MLLSQFTYEENQVSERGSNLAQGPRVNRWLQSLSRSEPRCLIPKSKQLDSMELLYSCLKSGRLRQEEQEKYY